MVSVASHSSESNDVILNGSMLIYKGLRYERCSTNGVPFSVWIKYYNWRSSVSGIMASLGAFVIMFPQYFSHYPIVADFAKFFLGGGLMALGMSSKDYNKGSNIPERDLPRQFQSPSVAASNATAVSQK